MTLMQRIRTILSALFTVLCAVLVLALKEDGFQLIAILICFSLVFYSLRTLVFYFTMGRYMVDGRGSLYRGLILLDLGIFTASVLNNPQIFVILYILAVNAFSGTIDTMRAMEARKLQSPSWRLNLASGIVSIVIAVTALVCGFVLKNMQVLTYLYIAGLGWSAALKLISAFRKTAIVYIQ